MHAPEQEQPGFVVLVGRLGLFEYGQGARGISLTEMVVGQHHRRQHGLFVRSMGLLPPLQGFFQLAEPLRHLGQAHQRRQIVAVQFEHGHQFLARRLVVLLLEVQACQVVAGRDEVRIQLQGPEISFPGGSALATQCIHTSQ